MQTRCNTARFAIHPDCFCTTAEHTHARTQTQLLFPHGAVTCCLIYGVASWENH